MLFDARLRPASSPARVNRALVTNERIGTRQGCMGLSHIHNEYPYRRYEQQNQGFASRDRVRILQSPDSLCNRGQCVKATANYLCLIDQFF